MKYLPIIVFLLLTTCTAAQNVDFYGKEIQKDVCNQYGMKDDQDAKNYLDKICDAADIPDNFVLVPCPSIDNCFALNKNGILYIVYDLQFFNKVKTFGFTSKNLPKNNVDWAALTVLAHELGHHMCQHTTNKLISSKYTPVELELQADEYAGTIMYKLGATLVQAQMAMNSDNVPLEASFTHPGRTARLDAIAKGWNKALKKEAEKKGTAFTTVTNSGTVPVNNNAAVPTNAFTNPNQPVQPIMPSIIVIPYTKQGEDIRTILESNENFAIALNKVKEGFDNRNFNTVDFVAKLKQAQDQKVFSGQNLTDIKGQLINFSGADIYVEVQLIKTSSADLNRVRVLLQAYDVSSARSLANMDCASNLNRSTDFAALTSAALSIEQGDSSIPCRDIFLNTMQASMERMSREGRPVTMQIGFSKSSKYNSDYIIQDKQLSDVIDEWLDKNVISVNQGGVTATTINYNEIRIPYRDGNSGRVYRVSSFVSSFLAFLKSNGMNATRDIKGGIIYITIN